MANTLWNPASERPRERTQPLLLATKTTWRDKEGKMLQGFSPTAYFLGCYADGQFWDEIRREIAGRCDGDALDGVSDGMR